MRAARLRPTGFTLVEILIVVIILGILASIIIGLFGNTSKDAANTSLKDNLRGIRNAIQVYLAQHATYPSLGSFESQMTQYTDAAGATSATKTATHVFGPYILAMPPLPVGTDKGKNGVTTLTYASGFGWGYDATTGTFRANCADSEVDGDGVRYNSY
jgi:prepilin-type N-terminal cleavage/methylation domain-containing protein